LARRYRADRVFRRKRLRDMWSVNTMDGRVRPLDGNRYDQELAKGRFFLEFYPIAITKNAGLTLKEFSNEFWGPDELTIAESKEQNA
jgi:hypothetical protein